MLWIVFNTLQLIIALKLLEVTMPANVQLIYAMIEGTINFQPIPKDTLYNNLVAFPLELPSFDQLTAESESGKTNDDDDDEE